MTLTTVRRSLGQRSRSVSDDLRNIEIAPEILQRFKPQLTEIFKQSEHEMIRFSKSEVQKSFPVET